MGIGNLNVSCSADINPAVANIGKLRGGIRALAAEVREAGPAFSQLESQITRAGNTAAEFERKMNRARAAKAAGVGNLDLGAVVDLREQTERYARLNNEIGKSGNLYQRARAGLKSYGQTMGFITKLASATSAAIAVVKVGFDVYQKGIKQSWIDWGTSIGNAIGVIDHSLDEANQKRSQKLDQQLAQVKEQRAQAEKYFRDSTQQNNRRISVARYGEEAVAEKEQFRDDVAKVGGNRAIALSNQRKQAAEFENAMAEKKRKEEERINALHQQRDQWNREMERRQQVARKNRLDDEKTVADLQREVADYWKTPQKRREEEALRNIEDPNLKKQASYAFQQLRAADRVKAESDARNNNPALSLAEAGTRESYVQRAAIRRQAEGDKNQKEMIVVLRQIRDNQDKKSGNLPSANI